MHLYPYVSVGQEARSAVSLVHLHLIGVTTCYQQVLAALGQCEVARVDACRLISYLLEQSVFGIHLQYRDAITLQSM